MRNTSVKQANNQKEVKVTNAISVMVCDQKQPRTTDTELGPAKDNVSCDGKTMDVVDKELNDKKYASKDQSNNNSADASETHVQPNALNNLLNTYASSDSSDEE